MIFLVWKSESKLCTHKHTQRNHKRIEHLAMVEFLFFIFIIYYCTRRSVCIDTLLSMNLLFKFVDFFFVFWASFYFRLEILLLAAVWHVFWSHNRVFAKRKSPTRRISQSASGLGSTDDESCKIRNVPEKKLRIKIRLILLGVSPLIA